MITYAPADVFTLRFVLGLLSYILIITGLFDADIGEE